jgi:dolichol-phosphate mannosyltransferase
VTIDPGAAVSDRNPALSVVAPCYNEADGLHHFHERVTAACRDVVGTDYEIVLVDDGSRDQTWPMIEELATKDPAVVGLSLSRNYGHQVALTEGLQLCRGERVLVIDSDLQDPPELLPRMMRAMDEGADVVYGVRSQRDSETAFKRGSAYLF